MRDDIEKNPFVGLDLFVDVVVCFLNFETQHMNDTVGVSVQVLAITFEVHCAPGL